MKNGSIRHWAISVRWILRHDMLGKWPKSQAVVVQSMGVTPWGGSILDADHPASGSILHAG